MKTRNGSLTMTHGEMAEAIDKGQAEPLAAGMTWTARHADAWWIVYEGRWLRVEDESLDADLDRIAQSLRATESVAARLDVLRRSLQIVTNLDEKR